VRLQSAQRQSTQPQSVKLPSLKLEQKLWQAGYAAVAGCDEVGRGAWAGPVSVGVVVVPQECPLGGVRDSKMLSEAAREQLYEHIVRWCVAWSVGHALPQECDQLGMSAAQRLAASRALQDLKVKPGYVLVDGRWDFIQGHGAKSAADETGAPESAATQIAATQSATTQIAVTQTIVKGDQISLSIAAASVLAKVTRDRLMRDISVQYPEFDFASNKGYPSPKHRQALCTQGATPIHRQSWAFMENLGLR